MNAYTAALSVALPDCRVLTSSRDIHSLTTIHLHERRQQKRNASLH